MLVNIKLLVFKGAGNRFAETVTARMPGTRTYV